MQTPARSAGPVRLAALCGGALCRLHGVVQQQPSSRRLGDVQAGRCIRRATRRSLSFDRRRWTAHSHTVRDVSLVVAPWSSCPEKRVPITLLLPAQETRQHEPPQRQQRSTVPGSAVRTCELEGSAHTGQSGTVRSASEEHSKPCDARHHVAASQSPKSSQNPPWTRLKVVDTFRLGMLPVLS